MSSEIESVPGASVFVSAVTNEFGSARRRVGENLRTKQWQVRTQEEFVQGTEKNLLDRLHTYIAGCSRLVFLVGRRSGSIPTRDESQKYRNLYKGSMPERIEEPSYTQWEFVFAEALGKERFIFKADAGWKPDEKEPKYDDPELQQRYEDWLFGRNGKGVNRGEFPSEEGLGEMVLKEEWPTPTAQGATFGSDPTVHGFKTYERRKLRAGYQPNARSLASDSKPLIGRKRERDRLKEILKAGDDEVVEIVGPAGAGKKKLLSQFEDKKKTLGADPADNERVEDLLESVWKSLSGDSPSTVTPHKRARKLKSVEMVVFAADVESSQQVSTLLEAMPKARLCITVREPISSEGTSNVLRLKNFADPQDMFDLFAQRYGYEIAPALQPGVIEICQARQGNPAQIAAVAIDAWNAESLESWVAENIPLSTGDLPEGMVPAAGVNDPATMISSVGKAMPSAVLVGATSFEAVKAAERRGEIATNSPRYRTLSTSDVADVGPDPELMADVLGETVAWSRMAGMSEIFDNRSFIVRMMQWADEQRRWDDVDEIGRNTELAMALGGRHGAWKDVLEMSVHAARERGDRVAEGQALHQLGSRSHLRDDTADARVRLAEAVVTREDHDLEAVAVSRGNLLLVPGAVISLVGAVVALAVAAAFLIANDVEGPTRAAVAEITPEVWELSDSLDDTETTICEGRKCPVTIRNVGTEAFEWSDPKEDGFGIKSTCDEAESVEPGDTCDLTIDVEKLPPDSERFVLRLVLADVAGDRGILVFVP